MSPKGFLSNHSGGIVGGISTGQRITVKIAFKPTSSIRLPGRSIDREGRAVMVSTKGRHDPCVGLRAVPIVEAMMALVLADHFLLNRAQNMEVDPQVPLLPDADMS
jgi:chorismate synthase